MSLHSNELISHFNRFQKTSKTKRRRQKIHLEPELLTNDRFHGMKNDNE